MSKTNHTKQTNHDKPQIKFDLPTDSRAFLSKMKCCDINPCLSQNHFICLYTKNKRTTKVPFLYCALHDDNIEGYELCNKRLMANAKLLIDRTRKLAEHFPRQKHYYFEPYDKMIIGEGGAYINLQTLKLHPLYGLPYIPASAIKGAMRTAGEIMKSRNTTNQALSEDVFNELFGTAEPTAREGALIFFDTFPSKFLLGLDVQTPHFGNYYTNPNNAPRDDMNPKIISSVCLKEPKFCIYIACRNIILWEQTKMQIDTMVDIVFHEVGIGAKTALGYGLS